MVAIYSDNTVAIVAIDTIVATVAIVAIDTIVATVAIVAIDTTVAIVPLVTKSILYIPHFPHQLLSCG